MSLIDLIFTNKIDDIICHGTLPKIADHDGILVSFNTKCQKMKQNYRTVYEYKNADEIGLINHIKNYDYENEVFSQPIEEQAHIFTTILQNAFSRFIPTKKVLIRPNDQAWCNSFTRLLLRKKNRNYQFYKKCELDYKHILT